MSGSSRTERKLSRCTVAMDSGIRIEWAPDENGSIEHGMERHRREEDEFRRRIDAATAAIEVVLDELEGGGHIFVPPTDATFEQHAQRGAAGGMPIIEVALACTPRLGKDALKALTQRISTLISEVPEAPQEPQRRPPVVAPPPRVQKRWWKFW